jgi:hypothetical protein
MVEDGLDQITPEVRDLPASRYTRIESDTEVSVEEEEEEERRLPAITSSTSSSFSYIREARAPFSSPVKDVPQFRRTVELRKEQVFTPEVDIATRLKYAFTALDNAGFNNITSFLDALFTTNFPVGTTCWQLQKDAWEEDFPQTVSLISRHATATSSYGKRPYDLTPYSNAITKAAETEYEREFVQFSKPRDTRQWDPLTGKKAGKMTPSILHKKATEVTGDWLGTNIIGLTQAAFTQKV